jgi:hypothetical protein
MHLRCAGIGKADVNAARNQGPHQTFRTVHSFISRSRSLDRPAEDQSFPAGFVKGSQGIAAIANATELTRPFGIDAWLGAACEIAANMACFTLTGLA